MNLQQTIADLEKQAAQYTDAANSLRALLQQEKTGQTTGQTTSQPKAAVKAASKKAASKGRKKASKKAAVSPETRAKISEALRASHAARKAKSA